MKRFASISGTTPIDRSNEHGGAGEICFRRILSGTEFASPIDFIDYTSIPPGSSIGRHEHKGNEEIYFVASGSPLMRVNGQESRLEKGGFAVVRSGEWHDLVNDTSHNVEILVIQVGLGQAL